MKHLISTLLLLFSFLIKAQTCEAVLFMKEGALLTYTDYDKKGKLLNSSAHKTIGIEQSDEGLKAVINVEVKDKKGKETFSTDYNVYCKNGLFKADMIRFFDTSKLSDYQENNLDLILDGDVLEFPVNNTIGDKLEDGSFSVKVNSDGFTLITMTFEITDREIVDEEEISTSAGTFLCQKVTFAFESKFGIIKIKGSGVEWYYNNAVIIRSESYNKKGKLLGYSELTEIK